MGYRSGPISLFVRKISRDLNLTRSRQSLPNAIFSREKFWDHDFIFGRQFLMRKSCRTHSNIANNKILVNNVKDFPTTVSWLSVCLPVPVWLLLEYFNSHSRGWRYWLPFACDGVLDNHFLKCVGIQINVRVEFGKGWIAHPRASRIPSPVVLAFQSKIHSS